MGVAHQRVGLCLHVFSMDILHSCVCGVDVTIQDVPYYPDASEDDIDYSAPKEAPASLKRSIPLSTNSTISADKKVISYIPSHNFILW